MPATPRIEVPSTDRTQLAALQALRCERLSRRCNDRRIAVTNALRCDNKLAGSRDLPFDAARQVRGPCVYPSRQRLRSIAACPRSVHCTVSLEPVCVLSDVALEWLRTQRNTGRIRRAHAGHLVFDSRLLSNTATDIARRYRSVARGDSRDDVDEPTSALSQFNALAPGDWYDVPSSLGRVVAAAQQLAQISDGAFDVTVGPLVNA